MRRLFGLLLALAASLASAGANTTLDPARVRKCYRSHNAALQDAMLTARIGGNPGSSLFFSAWRCVDSLLPNRTRAQCARSWSRLAEIRYARLRDFAERRLQRQCGPRWVVR